MILQASDAMDVNVQKKGCNEWAVIDYAAIQGSEADVRWLLNAGASLAVVDCEGETPLHLSVALNSRKNYC